MLTPVPGAPGIGIGRRPPINNWTDDVGNGAVIALDPATGELLWKTSLGGNVVMAPITDEVGGKQFVSVISGHTLVTFGLRD